MKDFIIKVFSEAGEPSSKRFVGIPLAFITGITICFFEHQFIPELLLFIATLLGISQVKDMVTSFSDKNKTT